MHVFEMAVISIDALVRCGGNRLRLGMAPTAGSRVQH
jgi:hypothetical protein